MHDLDDVAKPPHGDHPGLDVVITVRTARYDAQPDIDLTVRKEQHAYSVSVISGKSNEKSRESSEFPILKPFCYLCRRNRTRMEFRTPVHIAPFGFRIGHSHKGLLVGRASPTESGGSCGTISCPSRSTPFGTLFNPASIAATLKRLEERRSYDAGDLTRYEERWISFDHHGAFDGSDCEQTLRRINEALETGAEALRTADYAILTLGTAWIYELRDTAGSWRIATNCPQRCSAVGE